MSYPDLESLEILNVIVQEGSFAKASERVHKTQSALSYQVKKLEQQLGCTLIDRSQYRTTLTPAGRTLLEEGRKLLRQARHLDALASQLAKGWEPRLLLLLDGIIPQHPVLDALASLSRENIPTRVQLKTEFLGGVEYRFHEDKADLMVVKDYTPSQRLGEIPLGEMEILLCAAPDHPLSKQRQLELWQLQEHVELSVHDSSPAPCPTRDQRIFGCERVFFLSDFRAKEEALLMGLGFGWLPAYLAEPHLRGGRLKVLDYRHGSRYSFRPKLVYRLDTPLGPAAERLLRALRQTLSPQTEESAA